LDYPHICFYIISSTETESQYVNTHLSLLPCIHNVSYLVVANSCHVLQVLRPDSSLLSLNTTIPYPLNNVIRQVILRTHYQYYVRLDADDLQYNLNYPSQLCTSLTHSQEIGIPHYKLLTNNCSYDLTYRTGLAHSFEFLGAGCLISRKLLASSFWLLDLFKGQDNFLIWLHALHSKVTPINLQCTYSYYLDNIHSMSLDITRIRLERATAILHFTKQFDNPFLTIAFWNRFQLLPMFHYSPAFNTILVYFLNVSIMFYYCKSIHKLSFKLIRIFDSRPSLSKPSSSDPLYLTQVASAHTFLMLSSKHEIIITNFSRDLTNHVRAYLSRNGVTRDAMILAL